MKKEIEDKLSGLIMCLDYECGEVPRKSKKFIHANSALTAWKLVKTLMETLEKVRKPAKTMGQIEEKYFADQIITNVTMKEAASTIESV